jgi:DNA-binding transcriptional regulator YhcF (GntR family)
MKIPLRLRVDVHKPIPIRWQLTEQLKYVIEGGGVPPDQALPSIRELAGFLGINPNTVARAIEDLKRSGYVEARRGEGVFVTSTSPRRPSPTRREDFLKDAVIRAAALGMTPDDVAVGVLSLAVGGLAALREAVPVVLIECSRAELDFFGRELEAHLPVRVDKVLLKDLAATVRRPTRTSRWSAAVTSFGHLPEVERLLDGKGVPVIALLAEAHLETLHRLAQLPSGTRVGVVSDAAETAHNLEHSIANAALPNVARIETGPAQGPLLDRLVRRVDAIVCSTSVAARIQGLARDTVPVILDDRALNQRAIQMLGAILAQQDGDRPPPAGLRLRRRRAVRNAPAMAPPLGDGDRAVMRPRPGLTEGGEASLSSRGVSSRTRPRGHIPARTASESINPCMGRRGLTWTRRESD